MEAVSISFKLKFHFKFERIEIFAYKIRKKAHFHTFVFETKKNSVNSRKRFGKCNVNFFVIVIWQMHNSDGCFVCCDLFVSFCNWFRSLAIKSKSKTEYIRQLKSGKLKCAWMCTRSRQQSIEHVKIESAWFGRWIRIYGWLCMLGSDPVCVVFFYRFVAFLFAGLWQLQQQQRWRRRKRQHHLHSILPYGYGGCAVSSKSVQCMDNFPLFPSHLQF